MRHIGKLLIGSAACVMALSSAQAQLNKTNLTVCGASPGGMWSLVGAGVAGALGFFGIPLQEQLLISLVLCLLAAQLARKLHAIEAENPPEAEQFR